MNPEPWMTDALCSQVDPELFFPDPGGNNIAAKRVCQQCPVVEACREYALAREDLQGIWGATSTRQRARMRRAA